MIRQFAIAIALVLLAACGDVPDPSLPNEPVVAFDDFVTLKQNEITLVDLLANDEDIDGDPLTVEITSQPSNGIVEELEGFYFYTPDLYFVGSDEFSYQVTDLGNFTSSATVFLEVDKKEVYAVFATQTDTTTEVYAIDSRDPGTLIDLTQALPDGENLVAWEISEDRQEVVLLTDADRLLTVALDDPATLVGEFEVDTTSGSPDGGLVMSNNGQGVAVTLDHRYLLTIALEDGTSEEFDNGFEDGDMLPTAFSPLDTTVIMEGTLGSDDDARETIYVAPLSTLAPIAIFDDGVNQDDTFTRVLDGFNNMLWFTEDTATPVPPAAWSCSAPPPQTLSGPSFSSLGLITPGDDLVVASGLLEDPTDIISYNNAPDADSLIVSACPPGADLFQIVEIPYLAPETARVLTSATDTSDGLWNIDVGPQTIDVIYTVEGDTGLRTVAISLADTDPVETDLTGVVADFQTYTDGEDTRLPASTITSDALRWVYLAPVDGELTRLAWLQIETQELTTLDLPFAATNVVSNGLQAVVQGATGDAGSAPVALIEMADPEVIPVDVTGTLPERVADPLNQIESAIRLITIP